MSDKKAILVIGAGDATGGAIARRFAREGYVACVTRRSADKLQPLIEQIRAEGGQAHGFASDARKEEDMAALVPRPRGNITLVHSRPIKKPPNHAISQTLKYTRAVVSVMPKRTLAPMLNTATSIGAMSRSICCTSAACRLLCGRRWQSRGPGRRRP